MKAKFIFESLEDVLKPKSEEEINKELDKLSPNELLVKSSEIGYLKGVKKALEKGADVHVKYDLALRWASGNGHKDVVELLLKHGADIHAKNDEALRWASENGHKDIVKLLLKYSKNNINK